MSVYDKRLRNLLVQRGLLEEEAADSAVIKALSENKFLGEVVVEEQLVEEEDLIGAISKEMNLPPLDISRVMVDQGALAVLSQELAQFYHVLPIAKIGKMLTLAVANPFDIVRLDEIETVTGYKVCPVISTERSIRTALEVAYNPGMQEMEKLLDVFDDSEIKIEETEAAQEEGVDISALRDSQDSPVVKLTNLIIQQALKEKASDIHIEPFERRLIVRYRQDGILREAHSPPKRMQNSIVSRIKIMAELDIAERRVPQDGKFQLRYEGRQIDFRVSILPVVHGEKVVMRILDAANLGLTLDSLGFEQQALDHFREAIHKPYGMILVTGPTGSGKSTTLYSAIKEVQSITQNIVTIEDPVEYQLEGVNQVPINEKRGLTFAEALRSILRQDPNIILVGEIRDVETVETAIKAALTGHLVFSTLHTNDAPTTVTRLVDMGVDPFMVASATIMVSAQRLCRTVCQECKERVEIPAEVLLRAGAKEEELEKGPTLFRAKGCARCGSGYKGRFALLETLPLTDEIRRIVIGGGSALDVKEAAVRAGMLTLRRCAILNAMRGKTSLEEAMKVTMSE